MILNALAIQAAFLALTDKAAGRPDIDPNQPRADMELTGRSRDRQCYGLQQRLRSRFIDLAQKKALRKRDLGPIDLRTSDRWEDVSFCG